MQIKSLQIIGSRTSGGAERFYCRLATGLASRGQPVLAVNPPASAVAQEIGSEAPQAHVRMRNIWDPIARHRLRKLIRTSDAGIVQTYMGRATRLVRLPRASAPVHVARLGGFYDIAHYRHAHALIGNTQGICDYLVSEGRDPKTVFHLPNFVDLAPLASPDAITAQRALIGAQDDWLLLFAGRLHPNKGVAHLLEALAAVPEEVAGRRVRLVVLGDGPLSDSLKATSESLGLASRVHWAGWVADPDPWYAAADAFVCSSVHEPLGNVVLEAWAHRLPVIATRTDGPLEICEHESDALLVDKADGQALANAILSLLSSDAQTRAALGARGTRKLAQAYCADRVIDDYMTLYEQLLRARTR